MGETAEVSTTVEATPEDVYDVVADLPSMGRWSPECVGVTWLRGASAAVPGAHFRGHNRNGWRHWWTHGRIVAADRGRELAWEVTSFGIPVARWGYRFEPEGEGCRVTEDWEDRRPGWFAAVVGPVTGSRDRKAANTEGMRRTLERIKAEVESGDAARSS